MFSYSERTLHLTVIRADWICSFNTNTSVGYTLSLSHTRTLKWGQSEPGRKVDRSAGWSVHSAWVLVHFFVNKSRPRRRKRLESRVSCDLEPLNPNINMSLQVFREKIPRLTSLLIVEAAFFILFNASCWVLMLVIRICCCAAITLLLNTVGGISFVYCALCSATNSTQITVGNSEHCFIIFRYRHQWILLVDTAGYPVV